MIWGGSFCLKEPLAISAISRREVDDASGPGRRPDRKAQSTIALLIALPAHQAVILRNSGMQRQLPVYREWSGNSRRRCELLTQCFAGMLTEKVQDASMNRSRG